MDAGSRRRGVDRSDQPSPSSTLRNHAPHHSIFRPGFAWGCASPLAGRVRGRCLCVFDTREKFDGWIKEPRVKTTYRKAFDPAGRDNEAQNADSIAKKTPAEVQAWEKQHGLGAPWGLEENRAMVRVYDVRRKDTVGAAVSPA